MCAVLTQKEYNGKTGEKRKAVQKKYNAKRYKDPEFRKKVLSYSAKYAKDKPWMVNDKGMRYHARKLDQTPKLTQDESQEIKLLYYKAWCYGQVEQWSFHVDHKRPLIKGGLHHPDNLQILEASVNISKGSN